MKEEGSLRVGIAGYGLVGKRRRQFIDAHPYLRTVAVCDQSFEKSKRLEDGVLCFSSYQELLKEQLDIVFVSLPNYLAPEVTIAALKKGFHVFCEKPPGRDVKSIEDVIKVKSKRPQLKLKYGFNHRYHESVKAALKIVQSKELGEIINLRGIYGKSKVVPFDGNWRSDRKFAGGGILLDQGIHMVDLMRLFCGDFTDVKSFISNKFWDYDVEDNAYALIKDRKGRIAILHSSATQWQHKFSLEISMSKGYIVLRGILTGTKSYGEEELVVGRRQPDSITGSEKKEITTFLVDNSWREEIEEFAEAVLKNKPVTSGTLEEAYKTMKLVYAIYHADPQWREKYKIKK